MENNVLVIGGTGKTGRKVVERLRILGQNIRVGSRHATPSFDWNDYSTFGAALEGMEKVYIVYYPDLAIPGASDAIYDLLETAKYVGVRKVVLLSGKGEKEAEYCEKLVANSGLDYTLIRASWFNQNFSEGFLIESILVGHVALPMSDTRIPFVDTDDIADMVVEALMHEVHNGKTFEVTGPRMLTFEEVVEEIAKASNRVISYQPITLGAYKAYMKSIGFPSEYVWLLSYLFKEVLGDEGNQTISSDIEKILGRKAKDFSLFAKETAATGVWNLPVSQTV